ncbi:MAG: hypothetical protein ACI8RD_006627 [Bacillariaceae sp.]|jgi:hypothetical protein
MNTVNFRPIGGKHRKHAGRGVQSEVLGKNHTSKKCENYLKQPHSNKDLKLFDCTKVQVCEILRGEMSEGTLEEGGHKQECEQVIIL